MAASSEGETQQSNLEYISNTGEYLQYLETIQGHQVLN